VIRRAALAFVAAALLGVAFAAPASAASPVKDGWWSETNVGLGFSTAPPQVPSGGLYVENGYSGPVAIAAVTYQVPAGSAVGQLTLQVAGQAVITSPPVACPLTAAGRNYKPAQGGPWSQRPAYDCKQAQVTATVASNHSSVSFDTGPLLQDGFVAVAILAGGPADEIAFDPPGQSSLPVTPPGSSSPAGLYTPSGVSTSAPAPSSQPASGAGGGGSGASQAPGAAVGSSQPASSAAAPTISPLAAEGAPAAAPPASASLASPASSGQSRPALAGRSLAAASRPGGSKVGEILGAVGLVGLLVAYTEGYGLLGGRIGGALQRPARRRRPA
jgi:hypothetical protein